MSEELLKVKVQVETRPTHQNKDSLVDTAVPGLADNILRGGEWLLAGYSCVDCCVAS